MSNTYVTIHNSLLHYTKYIVAIVVACTSISHAELTRDQASDALMKAVGFFRTKVSAKGGYLWKYSDDLNKREGEGKAGPLTAWVQNPGTPSVGMAYLNAYRLTRQKYLLDASVETANALVDGQLKSGGWDYRIEFDAKVRAKYAYRVEPLRANGRNVTTLDDDVTQGALRFLMEVDRELAFKNKRVHESVEYALTSLLRAQYPNGAWPQRFSESPDPANFPVRKADFPEKWPRTWPKLDYREYYTFNDNAIATMIDTMFLAARIYDDEKLNAAAERAGDFIILAQLPEPQPAWAQQYNVNMHPAWARKFEPASVTGGESQGVMRVLLSLYERTGKQKFLEPVPRALAYLKKSRLKNGKLARFYEMKTNRPLYFTRKYELVYHSDDLPTHYGFVVSSNLESIERNYERLVKAEWTKPKPRRLTAPRLSKGLTAKAMAAIEKMDNRGAWVEKGKLKFDEGTDRVIDCRTFIKNVETLSNFIAAKN